MKNQKPQYHLNQQFKNVRKLKFLQGISWTLFENSTSEGLSLSNCDFVK